MELRILFFSGTFFARISLSNLCYITYAYIKISFVPNRLSSHSNLYKKCLIFHTHLTSTFVHEVASFHQSSFPESWSRETHNKSNGIISAKKFFPQSAHLTVNPRGKYPYFHLGILTPRLYIFQQICLYRFQLFPASQPRLKGLLKTFCSAITSWDKYFLFS